MTENTKKFKMPQTTLEKINHSEHLNSMGNEYLKNQEYIKGIKSYKRVFLFLNGLNNSLMDVFSNNNNGGCACLLL